MSRKCFGLSGAATTPSELRTLVAALSVALLVSAALVSASARASSPVAGQSRIISLHETGRLHLTNKRGFVLNEVGTASGPIRGRIYIHLKIVSTNRVTAEVNIYPSDGSLTGYATAAYRVAGPTASFTGTMSIVRGTGAYRRAHGSGLGFTGTIARSNDAVTVSVTGKLST